MQDNPQSGLKENQNDIRKHYLWLNISIGTKRPNGRPQRGLMCVTAGQDLRWIISPRHPTPKGSHMAAGKANKLSFRLLCIPFGDESIYQSPLFRRSRPAVTKVRPLWGHFFSKAPCAIYNIIAQLFFLVFLVFFCFRKGAKRIKLWIGL